MYAIAFYLFISYVVKDSYLGKIRGLIDKDIACMLVHSFVTSRLDYCILLS